MENGEGNVVGQDRVRERKKDGWRQLGLVAIVVD